MRGVSSLVIERCQTIAAFTDQPGGTTRTFLSPSTHAVHDLLRSWMEAIGMEVHIDAIGNLRGLRKGKAGRLLIGSHIDTVPNAGAYDGVLGVVLALALVELLGSEELPFSIEVIAFSEEEGVRYALPFLGSRAFTGTLEVAALERKDAEGITMAKAMETFGLRPAELPSAAGYHSANAYLEFHIEQGPALESRNLSLGVIDALVGQSRCRVEFRGQANHAGTTPMHLRRDALAGAAEWIAFVEREARSTPGLVATVGQLEVRPGAGNVIPGSVETSLDVRHASDAARRRALENMLGAGRQIAASRSLSFESELRLDQPAVTMDPTLVALLEQSVGAAGFPVHRMASGAGHDAMVLAEKIPAAMLFLRSPGGISHHPEETVLAEDVEAALLTGRQFLEKLAPVLAAMGHS